MPMEMHWLALCSLAVLASAKHCRNVTVPVTISARNGAFDHSALPVTNLDATNFVLNLTQQGHNFSQEALTGYKTTAGTYQISTTYCEPDRGLASDPVLQVLTHGIGFDRSYWDLSFNDYSYSYVKAATDSGYATLAYDRLGLGNSSHGDPLNEIQSFLEVAVPHALITMLGGGSFPGVKRSFNKIVAVGHSFGSAQTTALIDAYPDSVAAAVLTGFSTNTTFLPGFLTGGNFMQARLNAPQRFGDSGGAQDLPPGYLVSSNIDANQLLFFAPGGFDPKILELAEHTKMPVTVGELLTMGLVPEKNKFAGPVMILDGDRDFPFCGGDCALTGMPNVSSLAEASRKAFPNADFSSYIQPRTGHGINLHYNATGAYQEIFRFLKSKNLSSS